MSDHAHTETHDDLGDPDTRPGDLMHQYPTAADVAALDRAQHPGDYHDRAALAAVHDDLGDPDVRPASALALALDYDDNWPADTSSDAAVLARALLAHDVALRAARARLDEARRELCEWRTKWGAQ